MFKWSKNALLRFASVMLLLVAATGVEAACWFNWYQPEIPE